MALESTLPDPPSVPLIHRPTPPPKLRPEIDPTRYQPNQPDSPSEYWPEPTPQSVRIVYEPPPTAAGNVPSWSEEQWNVFNMVSMSDKRLVVIDSKAGSGKSTTLVECLRHVPSDAKVLVLAFGRTNAQSLQKRVHAMRADIPRLDVKVSTFHALGLQAWVNFRRENCALHDSVVNAEKTRWLLRQLKVHDYMNELRREAVSRMVSAAKVHGMVPVKYASEGLQLIKPAKDLHDDLWGWTVIRKMYVPYRGYHEENMEIARDVLHHSVLSGSGSGPYASKLNKLMLDFDDMLYLPNIAEGCITPTSLGYLGKYEWDYVFVDEAQDLSDVRAKLLCSLVGEQTRMFLFGDVNQNIYQFAGCQSNLFEDLALAAGKANQPATRQVLPRQPGERLTFPQLDDPLDERLPDLELGDASLADLSTSYRCPKGHIAVASKMVAKIRAREDAPEGQIDYAVDGLKIADVFSAEKKKTGTMPLIIGRRNETVVNFALYLLSIGWPAKVLGRGISEALLSFFDRHVLDGMWGARMKCGSYYFKTVEALMAADLRDSRWINHFHNLRDETRRLFAAYIEHREADTSTENDASDDDDLKSAIQHHFDRFDSVCTITDAMLEEKLSDSSEPFTIETVRRRLCELEIPFETDAERYQTDLQRVCLTTYHKSRGLEAEHVCVLNDKMLELKTKNSTAGKWVDWQFSNQAETNLRYIAMTRSKCRVSFLEESEDMDVVKAHIGKRAPATDEPLDVGDIVEAATELLEVIRMEKKEARRYWQKNPL
ncbi:hypothetical protein HK101_008802 [Irineochytrium annulatum]|nr:hypothetical protein HK101_008802 [Irineochytrium annulatum]